MQKIAELSVSVNEVTRVSNGTSIKGDLCSSSDVRVDGKVDGTVYSKGKVVVGEGASLSGNLLCTNLDIWGKMSGNIYIKDTLSIKGSAVIDGNIYVRKLQVEMGANINGSCKMINESEYEKAVSELVKVSLESKDGSSKEDAQPASSKQKASSTAHS